MGTSFVDLVPELEDVEGERWFGMDGDARLDAHLVWLSAMALMGSTPRKSRLVVIQLLICDYIYVLRSPGRGRSVRDGMSLCLIMSFNGLCGDLCVGALASLST